MVRCPGEVLGRSPAQMGSAGRFGRPVRLTRRWLVWELAEGSDAGLRGWWRFGFCSVPAQVRYRRTLFHPMRLVAKELCGACTRTARRRRRRVTAGLKPLSDEAQVRSRESAQVREHGCQVAI